MKRQTVSWREYVTVTIPCWWRKLLRLPLRTKSEWQLKTMTMQYDGEKFKCQIGQHVQFLQIEEQVTTAPYVGKLPILETGGYSWEGESHESTN